MLHSLHASCSESHCDRIVRPASAGGLLAELLKQQGAKFEFATARLEDRAAILADFERVRHCSCGALACKM